MINVLKFKDLVTIEEFLRNSEYDNGSIDVVMYIKTQERLNKLDMEYFKMNNPNVPYPRKSDVSDIKIKIGNINFIYKLEDSND